MMTFRMGAAGALGSAKAMASYLLEAQIPAEALRSAAYYGQTPGAEEAIAAGEGAAPLVRADLAPEVAEALGLEPGKPLNAEQLAFILAGRRADGEPVLVQEQHRAATIYGEKKPEDQKAGDGPVRHRTAYLDLTLSAPKSLSVAWAFAETEAERNSLLQATRTARDETLRYVEEQIVRARLGDGGEDGYERGRAAWISVEHYTARPTTETTRTDPTTGEVFTELQSVRVTGDPLLHSHNIMPVSIVTESGRIATMDTMAFHGRVHEFGAVFQAVLARELRAMGIDVALDERTGLARLPAIPQDVCDEFSKRGRDGEEAGRALAAKEGRDWDGMSPEARAGFLKHGAHSTRLDKESNTPDLDAWHAQAQRVGWEHRSVVAHGPPAPVRTYAERMDAADAAALPHLAEMLSKRAVIGQGDARLAAARGFIAEGIGSTDDMGAMMRHWAKGTVVQDRRETKLIWGETERGRIKLTTALHRDQEAELIHLARSAAVDRRHALAPREIAAAVNRGGLSYVGEHGVAQRAAVETLGTDGGLAVMIGAAGTGKTKAVLPPLVAAWQDHGLEVWGVAQAWRQARELESAGIKHFYSRALQPFLEGVAEGRTSLNGNSVVVLDELSQIGTRQLLHLLRLREEHGFKIVALGDNRQAQAIEAGPVIDLLRLALGEERIPEILTTVRQLSEDERRIATLFREGKAGDALAAKRENGTAELAPGGYRDAVERVADLYAERRRATHDLGPGYHITVSAPTNADAREIGRAVRERRREMGEVDADLVTLAATDGRGTGYQLALAQGDNVRLFARTRGVFTDAQGKRRSANVGDNGSVLRVEAVLPSEGLALRGESGKAAFVSWDALRDRGGSGRLLLAYGDVLTIDSAQGITSDEHINAMPAGSRHVQGFKAYVAGSRHRVRSYLIGSMGAEMREVRERRLSGLPESTPEQAQREAWGNVVRNLERQPTKESALAFLEKAVVSKRETVKAFQGALRRHEAREAHGESATTVRATAEVRQVVEALPQIAEALKAVTMERAEMAHAMAAVPKAAEVTTAIAVAARPAAAPAMNVERPAVRVTVTELEAQQQFWDAMRAHGLKPQRLPIMDGKLRYVPVEGNRGHEKSGAYRGFYDDGWPAGAIYNWKQGGFVVSWKANGEVVPVSAEEQAELARRQIEREAIRERERQAREEAGAREATTMWEAGKDASAQHLYLIAKGVPSYGLREDGAGNLLARLRGFDPGNAYFGLPGCG